MPDFDPKSIPILDDIIEEDATKSKDSDTAIADNEDKLVDSSLDLFNAYAVAPGTDDIDHLTDPTETETVESALMGFQPDDNSAPGISLAQEETQQHEELQYDDPAIHELLMDDIVIENTEKIPAQYIDIDSIVDEILYQLMPDLEQQIRTLIQQTLEEKLPAELIKPTASTNKK